MEKKLDLRIQRTYRLLTDALLKLLEEKDFEDITVSEICEHAMVRRATFYKHFGDKYELFAFIIRQLQEEFKAAHTADYDPHRPQTFYMAVIRDVLFFANDHRVVISSIFKSSGTGKLTDILSDEVEMNLQLHLKEDAANGAMLPGRPELIASMITGALIYTLKRWILNDMDVSLEEMEEICMALTKIM